MSSAGNAGHRARPMATHNAGNGTYRAVSGKHTISGGGRGDCSQGESHPIAEKLWGNCGKIVVPSANLPRPPGATRLHRRLTTFPCPFNHFGGWKTVKLPVLQQLCAAAKGTNTRIRWTSKRQVRENCGNGKKLRTSAPPPSPAISLVAHQLSDRPNRVQSAEFGNVCVLQLVA